MSEPEPRKEEDETPLTGLAGDAAAPMRLRGRAAARHAAVAQGARRHRSRRERRHWRRADLRAPNPRRRPARRRTLLDRQSVDRRRPGRIAARLQRRSPARSAAPGRPRPTHPRRAKSWPAVAEPTQSGPQRGGAAAPAGDRDRARQQAVQRHREPAHGVDRPGRRDNRAAAQRRTSPASASRRRPRPHRPRTGSSPSSTRPPIAAPSRRIASPHRRRLTSFRPAQ